MVQKDYYTLDEVAKWLRISKVTLREMIELKAIEATRVSPPGSARIHYRISKEAVDKFVNK